MAQKIYEEEKSGVFLTKIADYAQFTKLRLSSLVVLSAAICFAYGSEGTINWLKLFALIVGGFLVTGASNGINQILEKDTDKMMSRTSDRPLPQERMGIQEASVVSSIMGLSGILILGIYLNPLSGMLGFMALIMYTVLYTPMKKITPFAVFIGAFPGAIPPLLGYVAATNSLGVEAWILFAIQFIWQFPHFWAIAWVIDEDYQKAGFKMLPSPGGKDKSSAFQVVIYSIALIPISLLPVLFKMTGNISGALILICGILFAIQAYKLYKSCSVEAASKLMFASFIYLPVVQIAILLDKI